MRGLFIPGITVEMFRNGCLESIEALMAEGHIFDIEYCDKQAELQWVPCTPETMPLQGDLVWASVRGAKVEMLKLYGREWYSDDEDWMYSSEAVDAWKPLDWPEPYQPEEE